MGWWKIDPETGMPAKESHSALSRPPEFVLLNAVPGVDNDDEACYLGDGPWNMASTVPDEIKQVIGDDTLLAEQLRGLLLRQIVPQDYQGDAATGLLQVVDAFWLDVDDCYEYDWDRPAGPAERRWVCEYVVESLEDD